MSDPGQQPPPSPGAAPSPGFPTPPPAPASGFPPPAAGAPFAPPPPGAATPLSSAISGGDPKVALVGANRASGILLLVGALVLLVGSALPWAGIDAEFGGQLALDETTASGWSTLDGEVGDGPIFLVLALVLAVFGVLALRGVVNLGTKIPAIVVGSLAVLFAVVEFGAIASDNEDFNEIVGSLGPQDPLTYEYGLFVLLVGAVLGLVGAIMLRRRPKA